MVGKIINYIVREIKTGRVIMRTTEALGFGAKIIGIRRMKLQFRRNTGEGGGAKMEHF